MVYATHRTPTARSKDMPIGRMMGYMSELQFYMDIEGKCGLIDALWAWEFWPLAGVDDFFINLFKRHYERNYQSVYNQGADRGNEINNQILGWVNDLKSQTFREILRQKTRLQDFIDELERRVSALETKQFRIPIVEKLLKR